MRSHSPSRSCVVAAVTALAVTGALVVGGLPASASSPDLTVSQVYGGGGNSGATYTNDFVELFNRGSVPVDLSAYSVQYSSAAGTTWQVTTLMGSLAPGRHYLVQEGKGAGGTAPLPAPDATGTIAMSASSGKVALVRAQTGLSCGSVCNSDPSVADYVGYGTANDAETAPAPGLSNTTAAIRGAGGATDTDDNSKDFTAGTPTPRNTGDAGGGGGGGGPKGTPGKRIHDIQGAAHTSPLADQQLADVPGVVTALSRNGLWFQDSQPDADPATSEGLFVFTRTAPTAAVGDAVLVSGTVSEFRPGGTTGTNLTTTELVSPTIVVQSPGQPLPAATVVGPGGRVPPDQTIEDDASGSVETSGAFDPASDGIDFYESLEGMRLELDNAQVVDPTNDFGELPVVTGAAGVRTARGGIVAREGDFNPERVILDDSLAGVPQASVGDTLPGATLGVLDYGFGNYKLEVTATPAVRSGGLQRETTAPVTAKQQLAVATFNVENLDPTDPQDKFDRLAATIVGNLASPDIVALEEVQDNDGAKDDGVVAADQTIAKLTDAVTKAGGPSYSYRQIDPVNDQDGGEPGGNIRNVLLFRTDRGLSFVDRPGGSSTTGTDVVRVKGKPALTSSPGRIAPGDPAWQASRKPLVGEFEFRGKPVFVVGNHFRSKGGDQPLFGRFQPPARSSEDQRHPQAQLVRDFVDKILAVDSSAKVVVLGDLNDFDFSRTTDILVGDGSLVDLPRTLPLPERYTYDYEGNSEVLDHILISRGLSDACVPQKKGPAYSYDVVHVNSEFADQVSDHDPQVVKLQIRG